MAKAKRLPDKFPLAHLREEAQPRGGLGGMTVRTRFLDEPTRKSAVSALDQMKTRFERFLRSKNVHPDLVSQVKLIPSESVLDALEATFDFLLKESK